MESYPNLPEDILLEILSQIPAKSVGKCRCVCKSWRCLLSQPRFIRTHLQNITILNHESLIVSDWDRLYSVPLRNAHQLFDEITVLSATKISSSNLDVLGSCDGLLLVMDYLRRKWVMNPITREIRQVPTSPFAATPNLIRLYGIGYDSVSCDYKILLVYQVNDPAEYPEIHACVYSLKCGSWKSVGSCPYFPLDREHSAVSVSRCIHWLGTRNIDSKPIIVAFDLSEDKFTELSPPESCMFLSNGVYQLGVLGGCLSLFAGMNVWVMKENFVAESWTRYRFTIDDDIRCFSFQFLGKEQALIQKRYVHNATNKYFIHNLKQGTSMEIVIKLESFFSVGRFFESLVSPHGPWLS